MEWVTDKFGANVTTYGSITASVWNSCVGWHYSVEIWSVMCSYGSTNTEEGAKESVKRVMCSVVDEIVNDLAEITGENYHLELN